MHKLPFMIVLTLLLALLFGCATPPSGAGATGEAATTRPREGPVAVGQKLDISGPTLDGSRFDLDQFAGKVVLVDFWATWCVPCVRELPTVQGVYDRYHDKGFEVVGISFDKSRESLEGFVADRRIPWPQIFFDDPHHRGWHNPVGRRYEINAIPAAYLVDREGKVTHTNARGPALEEAVAALLGESGDG